MMDSNNVAKDELLRASEELDVLIVKSMREQQKKREILLLELPNELDIFMDKLNALEKVYQSIRIVDPIAKRVYEFTNGELVDGGSVCHGFWGKKESCDNCISIRALNENDSIFKLQIKDGRIYPITVVPIKIGERYLAVEMIKEASNSMLIDNEQKCEGEQAFSAVEYMNRIVVMDTLTELYNRRFMNERLLTDILNATIKKETL